MFRTKKASSRAKPILYLTTTVQRAGNTYPVEVYLLPKKNSSAVIKDGKVILRLSQFLTSKQREEHIRSLVDRISKRIEEQQPKPWEFALEDGAVLNTWGRRYMLHVKASTKPTPSIRIKDQAITVSAPASPTARLTTQIQQTVRRELAQVYQPVLEEFMLGLNRATLRSGKLNRVTFREQKSRWGSCAANGNINISSRLLFLPTELLAYVCIHELCHLQHMNHGKRFWALVRKFMPEFDKFRKQLHQY